MSFQTRSDICISATGDRKRASGVRDVQLFSEFIPGRLIHDVLGCLCLIPACRVDMVATAPELPMTVCALQFAELFPYHQALFPFTYPTNADILILGGISSNLWMWSGQHSASTMFTPFRSHNFRHISPMTLFFSPWKTCRRYSGAKTI